MQWLAQASQVPGFGQTAQGMDKVMGEEIKREDEQDAKFQAQRGQLFMRQQELEQRAQDTQDAGFVIDQKYSRHG